MKFCLEQLYFSDFPQEKLWNLSRPEAPRPNAMPFALSGVCPWLGSHIQAMENYHIALGAYEEWKVHYSPFSIIFSYMVCRTLDGGEKYERQRDDQGMSYTKRVMKFNNNAFSMYAAEPLGLSDFVPSRSKPHLQLPWVSNLDWYGRTPWQGPGPLVDNVQKSKGKDLTRQTACQGSPLSRFGGSAPRGRWCFQNLSQKIVEKSENFTLSKNYANFWGVFALFSEFWRKFNEKFNI